MTNQTLNGINGISNITAHFDSIDDLGSMKSMEYPAVGSRDVTIKSTKSKSQVCSARETGLVVVIVILILLAIGLIVLLAIFSYNNTSKCAQEVKVGGEQQVVQQQEEEVGCSSPTCIHLASRVLSLMDTRAAPCEDFYEYACGEGEKGSYISWLSPTETAYNKATKENKRRIREVLETEENILRGVNSSAVGKAKAYYKSCMNLDLTDQEGRRTVLRLIKDLGSWPVTTDALSGLYRPENFDLEDRLSRAFKAGSFPVMVMAVSTDPFNTSWNALQVGPGGFQVSSDSDNREKEREAFIKFFTTVTTSFGANPITAMNYAGRVWTLGLELSRISQGQVWRDALSKVARPSANEFSGLTEDYLDFGRLVKLTYGEDIPENERMLVLQTEYFRQLGTVLEQAAADKGVLATYIIWQVLVDMEPYLYEEIRKAKENQQMQMFSALTVEEERWETCVSRTIATFPDVVDGLYVEEFAMDNIKHEGLEMLEQLQSTLMKKLSQTGWMDTTTIKLALEKLNAMNIQIGFPEHVLDPAQLDLRLKHIGTLNPYHELENIRQIHEANYLQAFNQRNEMGNTTWQQSATEVLGLYNRFSNKIKFTVGHFQYPYYEPEFTWAMKLGTMGHLMAHELTHALDNQGRQNDATGELKNWWTSTTNASYSRHSKCFADDIKRYLPHANNAYLLHEVIADSGGIRLAYKALQDSQTSKRGLVGLDLTEEQLFFLSYAQDGSIKNRNSTWQNHRILLENLVLTSLKNTEDFSAAFSCHTGSPMNPSIKCKVW